VVAPQVWDKPGDYWFTVFRKGDVGAEGFVERTYFRLTVLEPTAVKKPVWIPPFIPKKKIAREIIQEIIDSADKDDPIVSEINRDGSWSIGLPKALKLPPGVEKLGGGSDVPPESSDPKTKGRLLAVKPITINLLIDERTLDVE
jgi:hypothetical protein